jgi:hypothetical protein
MIDARELRIGSLVEYGGRVLLLDESTFTTFLLEGFGGLVPIPLTEDWLVRMGFELNRIIKNGERDERADYYFHPNRAFNLHAYKYKNYSEGGLSLEFLPHVKFVHQLQNLYHALTGEELTIKEKA